MNRWQEREMDPHLGNRMDISREDNQFMNMDHIKGHGAHLPSEHLREWIDLMLILQDLVEIGATGSLWPPSLAA